MKTFQFTVALAATGNDERLSISVQAASDRQALHEVVRHANLLAGHIAGPTRPLADGDHIICYFGMTSPSAGWRLRLDPDGIIGPRFVPLANAGYFLPYSGEDSSEFTNS